MIEDIKKQKQKKYQKQYYEINKAKIAAYQRNYYKKKICYNLKNKKKNVLIARRENLNGCVVSFDI